MKNFCKIAQGIDTTKLLLAIQRKPDLWKADTYLRDYPQGPFAAVESIMLRFPPRSVHATEEALREHEAGFDQHENVDQPAYAILPDARPLVMNLMAYVQGERLGRIFINRIAPGGNIFPHADTPVHANYWERFHLVLEATPGVIFRCGDEKVFMAPGEIWWFQNAVEHEVINNSATDRTHLIIDIRCAQ